MQEKRPPTLIVHVRGTFPFLVVALLIVKGRDDVDDAPFKGKPEQKEKAEGQADAMPARQE